MYRELNEALETLRELVEQNKYPQISQKADSDKAQEVIPCLQSMSDPRWKASGSGSWQRDLHDAYSWFRDYEDGNGMWKTLPDDQKTALGELGKFAGLLRSLIARPEQPAVAKQALDYARNIAHIAGKDFRKRVSGK